MPNSIDSKAFRPVEVARPPYLHRYELFSPKLERRLTLFSWEAVLLWTMIESNPTIRSFCERPGLVQVDEDWSLADFLVCHAKKNEVLLLQDVPPLEVVGVAPRLDSALQRHVRTVSQGEFEANSTWIRNWQQILPYLAGNRGLLEPRQLDRICKHCEHPQMLVDIERLELPSDPIITRTSVFELARRGALMAEDLRRYPLSLSSRFMTV